MACRPERLKPRHIAVQGLRILLLHVADELSETINRQGTRVNFRLLSELENVVKRVKIVAFWKILLAKRDLA